MEFLRPVSDKGYPLEYLVARIKGKRSRLITEWEDILAAPDPAAAVEGKPGRHPLSGETLGEWDEVLPEYRWLYCQMEDEVRRDFLPFFAWFELTTVILAFRHRSAGEERMPASFLETSLLSKQVGRALSDFSLERAARAVADAVEPEMPERRALVRAFREHGVGGFEEALYTRGLARTASSRLPHPLGDFFRRLVDIHNLRALAKELRWHPASAQALVAGGNIAPSALREAVAGGGRNILDRIADRLAGGETAGTDLDTRLFAGMGRLVRRLEYEPSGRGVILGYLWRLAMEGRNLRLVGRYRMIDRAVIRRELVT